MFFLFPSLAGWEDRLCGSVASALSTRWCPFILMIASSSDSSDWSSIHSIRGFHTLAISCHTRRFGFSMMPILFQASSESALSRCRSVRMRRTPCSFAQATNLPDRDHLMAVMVPSPECKMVSLPPCPPRPIAPSHPCAACDAALVLALDRTPMGPPTVWINSPASPPDKYERSFL